jgi:prevent-host-death family protein
MSTEPAAQFNIHEAQANLSRLIARVEGGEEIIISRAGKPVAKLVPLTSSADRRGLGPLRDAVVVAEDRETGEATGH